MLTLDSILEKFDLSYDDLTKAERETANTWIEALRSNQLTIPRLKEYIHAMRTAVEQELTGVTEKHEVHYGSKHDIYLKARLRNYMLLEAFLDSPVKAQKALENMLSGMVKK